MTKVNAKAEAIARPHAVLIEWGEIMTELRKLCRFGVLVSGDVECPANFVPVIRLPCSSVPDTRPACGAGRPSSGWPLPNY